MNLQSTDFELFGLKPTFAQDIAVIDARWKALQREAHPDKFAAQGAAAQRVAMQWSVRINEAYQRLKSPLKRAAYVCELAGHPVNAHSNTAMPAAFLMQQMEWREALEEASTTGALAELQQQVQAVQAQWMQQCEQEIDVDVDLGAAVLSVRALMFIDKFMHELDQAFDRLEA